MTRFGRVFKNDGLCRLNGSADRILSPGNEKIQGPEQLTIPQIAKIRFYFALQGFKPMILAAAGISGQPAAFFQPTVDARTDGVNGRLEALQIARRLEFDHAPACRTPIAL